MTDRSKVLKAVFFKLFMFALIYQSLYKENVLKKQLALSRYLQPLNMSTNNNDTNVLPNIIDVEWKLEVKTNTPGLGSDNLLYHVLLKTDDGKDVKFTCGSQQLQDLVYKLKDLVRHCEKVKNEISS